MKLSYPLGFTGCGYFLVIILGHKERDCSGLDLHSCGVKRWASVLLIRVPKTYCDKRGILKFTIARSTNVCCFEKDQGGNEDAKFIIKRPWSASFGLILADLLVRVGGGFGKGLQEPVVRAQ